MRQIVLRKISGVFEACWGSSGRPSLVTAGRAPSLLATVGYFFMVLLVPLLALLLLASLTSIGHALPALVASKAMLGGLVLGETEKVDAKKLMDELNTAFAAFKRSNDERLTQIEAKGQASADVIQNVEKANKAITDLSTQLSELQKNMREIENNNARLALAGTPEERRIEARHAAQFFSLTRGHVVDQVTDDDMQSYRAYKKAFNAYLRRGNAALNESEIRNALSTGSATSGGLWVTPDTSGRMVELIYQTSLIRQLASVQSIGTDTLEGWNDLDEGSSGWVGETDARPETNTPLPRGKWSIPVYEQYANPKITQKMLDDSFFDVEAWLAKKVSDKMTRTENTAFATGNGTNRPRGFMDYGATAITGKQTAQTWKVLQYLKTGVNGGYAAASATVSPADKLIDLITLLKVELRNGACFVGNSTTLAETRKLKDAQGNYLFFPTFQNSIATPPAASSLGAGNPVVGGTIQSAGSLLGFPFYELQDMDDMSNNGFALAFGNLREAYQIVDHNVGVRVLRDPFTGKPYTSFYTTKRVGGDLINFEALKLLKFST